jgi:DNA-binding NarL/FixJ family response regulator
MGTPGRVLRVLVVEDKPVLREGLRALLATHPGLEVMGMAADGADAVCIAEHQNPDVVLMDIRMPVMDGLCATTLIKQRCLHTRVVLLTFYPGYEVEAIRVGADAFLLKAGSPEQLFSAILGVAEQHRESSGGKSLGTATRST